MSGKKKTKEDYQRELGLIEGNENSLDLWRKFTDATALVAEKALFTDEHWKGSAKPENLSWASINTTVRNRLFDAVKKELEGEVYSNGEPFTITYTAFEWKMKQATTYRLSDRYVRPSTSRTIYDPVRER